MDLFWIQDETIIPTLFYFFIRSLGLERRYLSSVTQTYLGRITQLESAGDDLAAPHSVFGSLFLTKTPDKPSLPVGNCTDVVLRVEFVLGKT